MSVGSCTSCGSHSAVKSAPAPRNTAPAPAPSSAPVSAAAPAGTGKALDIKL